MKIKHPTTGRKGQVNGCGFLQPLPCGFRPAHVGCSQNGSVLIIVLWISIGLVAIALYFVNSMTYELRASDNRVSGLAAEQAIEGGARYVSYVLSNFATNGAMPGNKQFDSTAVPVGDAHFWLIGRDPSGKPSSDPYFGLIDEASKLNLNTASTNSLLYLPNMTLNFANAIADWRSTNGLGLYSLNYNALGYSDKNAPFETEDELRLVYGATMDLLTGEDLNQNGILDSNEKDLNGNGQVDPGLFEYVTVYSREPNFNADGNMMTNVNNSQQLQAVLQSHFGSSRANEIISRLGTTTFASLLQFYLASGLSSSDFAQIADGLTASTNAYTYGLVNINTADDVVLTALFMGVDTSISESTAESAAQNVINYREQNSSSASLNSVAWVADALGSTSPVVRALAGGDYITTRSFQFTADIAAVGPFGRGYRRVKFIFDTSNGTPQIIYRQDLSQLGWALGDKVRATLVANAGNE